jgi:hypothetical protein
MSLNYSSAYPKLNHSTNLLSTIKDDFRVFWLGDRFLIGVKKATKKPAVRGLEI